ncbi:MAG: GrlR family regulatory protein [Kiloniellales bacterium]|jgi:hypothetical protein|nr:GrlR family regulatory protein [Kiloniellales bacterium]
MSIDGIWTGEVYGPFGWENRGVFLLENGRIVGGDNRQYSVGSYRLAGQEMSARLKVHYYGPPRTMFGETREEFPADIAGTLKDHEITGTISRPDKPQFDLQIRLTKRLDLPFAADA